MSHLLWLIPAFPFAGALLLILAGTRLPRTVAALAGVGSVGLSALLTLWIGISFLAASPPAGVYTQQVWQWMDVAGFSPAVAFHWDALSMVFAFVITFVGFLIHLYSVDFMRTDDGFARFFAYMNLFVGSMLILVLADNLLLMYLGWEGVGLCSYLLIGFWYQESVNGYAARKAFIITRVGDTAMAIGLFLLFQSLGTLHIETILTKAPQIWNVGSETAVAVALLLLGGAVGKSAQLPLQTWLPDAMAGPSPVSALIHAATMVTAGVYLIARTHVLFELAPFAQAVVAGIGAVTLLLAGCAALTQYDLKRVLAYSTISQIGYMFLALGVGAWSAAIFHFMIHAFFKALLFLSAGAVIMALHHEHNIFQMGGLRKQLPVVFWTFLIGAASLAALPLITAGFYSKDQILWLALASEKGNEWLYVAALLGAFLTALYTFRMVFVAFYGPPKTSVSHPPGRWMQLPLVVLAVLSLIGGVIELPHTLGHLTLFSDILKPVLPETPVRAGIAASEWIYQGLAALLALGGVFLAYLLYVRKPHLVDTLMQTEDMQWIHRFWLSGWGFDKLYDWMFLQPFVYLSALNKNDVIDKLYTALGALTQWVHRWMVQTQNGLLRWYMMGVVLGAVFILTLTLLL